MSAKIQRLLSLILLFFISIFHFNYVQFEYINTQLLKGNVSDEYVSSFYEKIPYEKPIEMTITTLFNSGVRDCSLLKKLTNSLLEINPNSYTAYYIKGVCAELAGEFSQGVSYLTRAQKNNPYNPDILYALAVLKFKSGDYSGSKDTVVLYKEISLDLSRLSPLEKALDSISNN